MSKGKETLVLLTSCWGKSVLRKKMDERQWNEPICTSVDGAFNWGREMVQRLLETVLCFVVSGVVCLLNLILKKKQQKNNHHTTCFQLNNFSSSASVHSWQHELKKCNTFLHLSVSSNFKWVREFFMCSYLWKMATALLHQSDITATILKLSVVTVI